MRVRSRMCHGRSAATGGADACGEPAGPAWGPGTPRVFHVEHSDPRTRPGRRWPGRSSAARRCPSPGGVHAQACVLRSRSPRQIRGQPLTRDARLPVMIRYLVPRPSAFSSSWQELDAESRQTAALMAPITSYWAKPTVSVPRFTSPDNLWSRDSYQAAQQPGSEQGETLVGLARRSTAV